MCQAPSLTGIVESLQNLKRGQFIDISELRQPRQLIGSAIHDRQPLGKVLRRNILLPDYLAGLHIDLTD